MTGFTAAWNILMKIKYTRKKHYPSNLPVKVLATLDFTNLSVNISTLKLVLANVFEEVHNISDIDIICMIIQITTFLSSSVP